jgi:hypothetical protein
MKPRHFLVMALISGYLLPLSQVVLASPVLKGHELGYYEKGQNHNADEFSPIMISSNCGQGPPAGQVGQQDLTPLLIAWGASILLTIKLMKRADPVETSGKGLARRFPAVGLGEGLRRRLLCLRICEAMSALGAKIVSLQTRHVSAVGGGDIPD